MPLHTEDSPIQRPDDWRTELENIQGNILNSHGRRHVAHIFFEFSGQNWRETRDCIAAFSQQVSSAWDHVEQTRSGIRDQLFTGLCISRSGYEYLRVPVDRFTPAFTKDGLRGLLREEYVPASDEHWARHLRDPHLLVIIGHSDADEARRACLRAMAFFSGCATATVDWGSAETNDAGQVIEHFGFVDGISQPRFFAPVPAGPYDESAGPSLVLREQQIAPGFTDVGSWFVYWKLRQDVARFRAEIASLAQDLGVAPEFAEALVVGRFKDGTPLVASGVAGAGSSNAFDYSTDPGGHRCPMSAHIRKANPRRSSLQPDSEAQRRIARRGITYTELADPQDKGLLFQCCQASIESQFEFILRRWFRSGDFPSFGNGSDRLLGPNVAAQSWPTAWAQPAAPTRERRFPEFVRSLGGAYFFIPGKHFLSRLPAVPPSR